MSYTEWNKMRNAVWFLIALFAVLILLDSCGTDAAEARVRNDRAKDLRVSGRSRHGAFGGREVC